MNIIRVQHFLLYYIQNNTLFNIYLVIINILNIIINILYVFFTIIKLQTKIIHMINYVNPYSVLTASGGFLYFPKLTNQINILLITACKNNKIFNFITKLRSRNVTMETMASKIFVSRHALTNH